jgi:hypothetical protein
MCSLGAAGRHRRGRFFKSVNPISTRNRPPISPLAGPKNWKKIDSDRGTESSRHAYRRMKKSDLTCPECGAGYRRIELDSKPGSKGKYRCLVCNRVLEIFDGSKTVALRLTVQPAPPSFSRIREQRRGRLSGMVRSNLASAVATRAGCDEARHRTPTVRITGG